MIKLNANSAKLRLLKFGWILQMDVTRHNLNVTFQKESMYMKLFFINNYVFAFSNLIT